MAVQDMFGRKKKVEYAAPDLTVRAHESGYLMRKGEKMVLSQEVMSPEGEGWFIATNMELVFVHPTRGIYLHVLHSLVESVKNDKNKITITWNEGGKKYDFQMRLKDGYYTADDVIKILDIQFKYGMFVSEFKHVELDPAEIEKARQPNVRLYQGMLDSVREDIKNIEVGEMEDDINLCKREEQSYARNLEYFKTMPIVRSTKIPEHIPLKHVWNDCYYDEKKEIYVTFRMFVNGVGQETLANQAKLGYDGDGLAFAKKDVTFVFGRPALKGDGKDGWSRYSILCTLTEEMITEELVLAMFGLVYGIGKSGSSEVCLSMFAEKYIQGYSLDTTSYPTIYYETEAPRWIGGRYFKLTNAERRAGMKYLWWLLPTNNPELGWINKMEPVDLYVSKD